MSSSQMASQVGIFIIDTTSDTSNQNCLCCLIVKYCFNPGPQYREKRWTSHKLSTGLDGLAGNKFQNLNPS